MGAKTTDYPISATVLEPGDKFDVSKKISSGPDVFQSQKYDFSVLLSSLRLTLGTGNLIFVDSVLGVDITGARERPFTPFLTPLVAEAAANAGDCIIVRPGTYTASNLGKNGVNWFFMPGATFTHSTNHLFYDNGVNISFNIYGHAKINSTGGAAIAKFTGGSTVNVECDEFYNISGDAKTAVVWGGSKLNIRAYSRVGTHILNATGSNYEIKNANSELNIKTGTFNVISSIYSYSADLTTKFSLECDTFENIHPFSFCAAVYSEGGYYNIKSKQVDLNQTADPDTSSFPNFYFPSGAGEVYFNFDRLNKSDSRGYDWLKNVSSTNKLFIHVGNTLPIVNSVLHLVNGQMQVSGNIINDNSATRAIRVVDGTMRLKNLHISNISADAASVIAYKTAGNLVLDNVTMVLGNTTNDDILAIAAQNVLVYSAVSNAAAANVNVTELVGTITRDSNVI